MDADFDLAIVGMACRFPGAGNLEAFWRNLAAGVESIRRLSPEDLTAAGVPAEVAQAPDYVPAAPVLDDPGRFDAGFFGYSPAEAAALDPQHRLLLELSHWALEDAGCNPAAGKRRIGVFAGSAMNTYFIDRNLGPGLTDNYIPVLLAADKDFLATRVSYKLGLTGPSLTVQTACSTSLVAIHLARQSLLAEECDVALAGAVSVRVPHAVGYRYDGSGVVSRDGHVRAFGAAATGTVFGSGGGVVALRRLADALADGDHIYAVVKGSAINNDGAEKAGYSAPSVRGQAEAVIEAIANAGVSAADLSYLEAHGSGTPVGDRIEVLALTEAFRRFTAERGFCALGSVKSNIGHLDAAAGIAGVIKTALALDRQQIPPTLHAETPNPEIDFAASPFYVAHSARAWPRSDRPRLAGVMATGMGGTNAHVVLGEAPEPAAVPAAAPSPQLFVLSARSPDALDRLARDFAAWTAVAGGADAADTAWTLQVGRRPHRFRRCRVADAAAAAAAGLADTAAGAKAIAGEVPPEGAPEIAFLLPGVGDHYAGMGRGLYDSLPVFRAEIDRCAERLMPLIGTDIRQLLYPAIAGGAPPGAAKLDLRHMLRRGEAASAGAPEGLQRTLYCQPALFAVEYALARQWIACGVTPGRLIGHSLGEWVAAALAGVFTLEDALRLVALRARLVDALPHGEMTAVMAAEAEVAALLPPGLAISLLNGPKLCVVAGPAAPMEAFRSELQRRGVLHRAVKSGHAFHSPMLAPIAGPFRAALRTVAMQPPAVPLLSNVTGDWIRPAEACDPEYWVKHACETARFGPGLERLWEHAPGALLEVGPGRTLGVLAFQHPSRGARKPLSLPSLRAEYEGGADLALWWETAGRLWTAGIDLDWSAAHAAPRRKVTLPPYPFAADHHWHAGIGRPAPAAAAGSAAVPLAEWFYVPTWIRVAAPVANNRSAPLLPPHWIVVGPGSLPPTWTDDLTRNLIQSGSPVARLTSAGEIAACLALVRPKLRDGGLNVVLLPHADETGFFDALTLAQALAEARLKGPVRLAAITRCAQDVTGAEALKPHGGLLAGLMPVVAREHPGIWAFAVDVDAAATPEAVVREFVQPEAGSMVALRGRTRWRREYRPERIAARATGAKHPEPRMGGCYLITGGTGGIGLEVARDLARRCRARLVLLSRRGIAADADGALASALQEMRAAGAEVEVLAADVTCKDDMVRAVTTARERFGPLHGVFHAAGQVRDGMLELKTPAEAAATLAPKVEGTLNLWEVLQAAPPDFLALFSSASAFAGYHGQADYAAANAFLDAFASYASAQGPVRTVAINWPVWKDTGMARGLRRPRFAIDPADGVEALRRVLASGLTQVAVSPVPLDTLLRDAAEPPAQAPLASAGLNPASPEPDANDPRTQLQTTIAGLWQSLLGRGDIGPDEDFISAGGHSLLAMRIVAQIRAQYEIDFTLRKFFAAPTIAGNATAVHEAIVADIENLTDEEADRRSA